MASEKQVKKAKVRKLCEKGNYKSLLQAVPQEELRQAFEPDLTQPIHYFAARGNIQAVRELVEKYKCNPECQNVHGITPLHCASYCGRLSVVKSLVVKHKCDANVRDKEGACPLAYTSYCVMGKITKRPLNVFKERNKPRSEHIQTAKFLLCHATIQRASLTKELCVLRLPVYCGSFTDFIQLEYSLNLKLGDSSPELGSEIAKCLEIALSREHTESGFVESIMRTYAYPIKVALKSINTEKSSAGPYPFHIACSKADIGLIKSFVELNICKPDVRSVKVAIDRNDYELVQLLLQSADHPLLMDRFDNWSSMLSYIFYHLKDDEKLVRLVVDATAGTDIRDADGNTPLHLLCNDSIAFIPEEYSCYQSMPNSSFELPVHIASKSSDLKLIKLVSSQLGEDINQKDIDGNTPLHIACKSFVNPDELVHCVEYFIHEKNSRVNIQNELRELPLHTLLKHSVSMSMSKQEINKIKYACVLITSSECYKINAKDSTENTPLHLACKMKYPDIVLYLISKFECDINIQNDFGELPLHILLKQDNTYMWWNDDIDKKHIIEMITNQCNSINAQDSDGNTPLHIACKIGDPQTVLNLTSKFKCDLNITNNEGSLPLHYALSSNLSVEVLRAVSSGCTLKCKQNNDGKTPLHIASEKLSSEHGYMEYDSDEKKVLLDLICCQESINVQDREGNMPLHIACRNCDLETATYLSKFQCDLDLINKNHCLPLHYAVRSLELVKIVASGCTLMHMQNSDEMTPLHIACRNDFVDVVKYLVFEKKCIPNEFKQSPGIYDALQIHLACKSKCDINLLKALANGQNVNNKRGYDYAVTPIHIACENRNPLAVKLLLELKCDLLCKGVKGMLPIHVACSKSLECVQVMAPYTNNEVNQCDRDGNTPLHIAIQNNHLDIVVFLLSTLQCDVSIKNSQGELPLHLACKTNQHVVRMVMEKSEFHHGTLVNYQTRYYPGDTPLHIACKLSALDIVKYLTESFDCEPSMRLRNKEDKLPVDYACEHSLEMVKLVCQPCTVGELMSLELDPEEWKYTNMYFIKEPTALDIACSKGSLDTVMYLINDKGCNLSGLKSLYSALWYACGMLPIDSRVHSPKLDIVQFLIDKYGFDPHMTVYGTSIFQYSCRINSLQLVKVLSVHKMDSQDGEGNTLLHYACRYGSIDIVKYLVEYGCNQNMVNSKGDSPLHMACQRSLEVTKLLTNCDVNLKNGDLDTPLHLACTSRTVGIAEHLIEDKNCDVKVKNKDGKYALHKAVLNLLKIPNLVQRSDINCQDDHGDTPLHIACNMHFSNNMIQFLLSYQECRADILNEDGDLAFHVFLDYISSRQNSFNYPMYDTQLQISQIVKMILKRYRAAVVTTNHDGLTPIDKVIMKSNLCIFDTLLKFGEVDDETKKRLLYKACEHGRSDIVHWLINHGASTDVTDDDDNYPQHSCFKSDYNCLKTLKQLGPIDVCKQDKNNDTILHLACKVKNKEVLKYILQSMDNCEKAFSIQNINKDTPFHLLATSKCVTSDILALIECDNPNLQDKSGNTALHLACQHGNYEIVEHLITKCKCDHNVTNDDGELPLHIAVAQSQLEIAELLASPVNVNECTKNGDSPLHIACQKADLSATNLLLNHRSNPNALNKEGNTPLHIAAAKSLAVVKIVATSDNINMQNADGNTPLHIGCQYKTLDIALYLVKELKCSIEVLNSTSKSAFHILFSKSHFRYSSTAELPKSLDLLSYYPHHLKDITDDTGDTILHIACQKADHEVVQYLVETLGCKVDAVNELSGATPLHFACNRYSLSIVELVSKCNPLSQIKNLSYLPKEMEFVSGDTPLHVACRKGNIDVIRHLLRSGHSKPLNYPNDLKEIPIHLAVAANQSVPLINLFISFKDSFDCNATNELNGDTPLHIICRHKPEIASIKRMIHKLKCKIDVHNKEGNFPLHIACQNKRICKGICKVLCDASSDEQIKHQNTNGNTALYEFVICQHNDWSSKKFQSFLQILIDRGLLPTENPDDQVLEYFHLACRYQKVDIIKCFYEMYTSLSQKMPITFLYEACLNCNKSVLLYLLNNIFKHAFDALCNVPNENGDLPLHLAARMKVCMKSTILLVEKTKDINHQNNQGNTPLHELYSEGKPFNRPDVLLACLEKEDIDFSKKSKKGFTSLHCMCTSKTFDDLKIVLEKKIIDANIQDENGTTLLHLACQANDFECVECLVKVSKSNPSIEDHHKQAPITLTTDPKIIKLLLEYGANPQPLSKMHKEYFKRFSCENPPPTPVKLLVIGYPSVGKTTLIKSLHKELSEEVISEHFDHTAGIVTTNFSSQHYGDVTFYDFAGQAEYYASHDAVLHMTIKNVPPVVLILVNLNESTKIILNQTNYWIIIMANRCSGFGSEAAHMILVGSHADVLEKKSKNPVDKLANICQSVKEQLERKNIVLKGSVCLDCTKYKSCGMSRLHQLLQQSTSDLREKGVMDFNSHCFYVFLLHMFRNSNVVTLGRILSALKSKSKDEKDSPLFALPSDRPKVIEMCHDLNEKGHIMFIEHPTIIDMSWLIREKAPLLHEILGTLFSPTDFPQHCPLSYSTGVVPLSRFDKQFSTKYSYPSTLSLSFLSRMEYCREIKDPVILESIVNEEEFSVSERYYFFPNLVSLERPTDKWSKSKDSKFTYNSGWLIQCKTEDENFSPHFIQALLLRLAFSFTPKKEADGVNDIEIIDDNSESEEEEEDDDESQIKEVVMKRLCSVWKNGIYWMEASGVKTVVEVIDQNTLVLLMQCLKDCEIDLLERRSSIISMVLSAKDEFCSKAELREYFLHPKVVTHPLPNLKDILQFMFPLHQVVNSIKKKSLCVINDLDGDIMLEELLYYEPFSELNKDETKLKFRNFPYQEKISIFRGRKPTIQGI